MQNTNNKVALVTGASSGIGFATAQMLAQSGWIVYAGARRLDAMKPLCAHGCLLLALDVTSEASMKEAVCVIEGEHGALNALINNAGIAEAGAVESVSVERWRSQFETNVFGLVRLCQIVLPAMRAQGRGHIVNVSSMGGEVTTPLFGAYNASKYALESLSDAMRFEVAPWGIRVVVIQPGAVATPILDLSAAGLDAELGGPYSTMSKVFQRSWQATMGNHPILLPGEVARAISDALEADEPPTRVKVGAMAQQMTAARRATSDHDWDAGLRPQFGLG